MIECSEDKVHEVKVIELDNGHMKGKGHFDGGQVTSAATLARRSEQVCARSFITFSSETF